MVAKHSRGWRHRQSSVLRIGASGAGPIHLTPSSPRWCSRLSGCVIRGIVSACRCCLVDRSGDSVLAPYSECNGPVCEQHAHGSPGIWRNDTQRLSAQRPPLTARPDRYRWRPPRAPVCRPDRRPRSRRPVSHCETEREEQRTRLDVSKYAIAVERLYSRHRSEAGLYIKTSAGMGTKQHLSQHRPGS